jgi:8-oxo-dGTP pyrophosphatase MutT (NUDIX family)
VPGPEIVAANGRRFATFAAAVLVFIVDPATEKFLLLESPAKRGRPGWEIVNGGVEADETLEQAALREVSEEAGPAARVRLRGTVYAETWRYDDVVTHMTSVAFLADYLGGEIVPGDDMAGCAPRWFTLEELRALDARGVALIPESIDQFERAARLFPLPP